MNRVRCFVLLTVQVAILIDSDRPSFADVFDLGTGLTNLEFVAVGDEGNPADTEVMTDLTTGYGSVAYSFRMGKFEVTAAQYTEFLNAVASTDTYGLYNTLMDYDAEPGQQGANIKRTGSPGSYSYNVAADWANRPVNYVSLWDAMRFANWLHNGQPAGAQDDTTTEDGAYDLEGYTGDDGVGIMRKPESRYWIPSEDEWYKSAFYDPVADAYYDFATGTDGTPSNVLSNPLPDPGNNATYYDGTTLTLDPPYYRSNAGDFENSASPYGTFDQSGNIEEWTEDALDFTHDPPDRLMRGGYYGADAFYMRSSTRTNNEFPSSESAAYGFRVAAFVPEPASAVLWLVAALNYCCRNRRKS